LKQSSIDNFDMLHLSLLVLCLVVVFCSAEIVTWEVSRCSYAPCNKIKIVKPILY